MKRISNLFLTMEIHFKVSQMLKYLKEGPKLSEN